MYIAPSPPPPPPGDSSSAPAPAAGARQAPDIAAQVMFDQINAVYRLTPGAMYASLMAAALVAVMLWDQAPHAMVLGWLLPKSLFALLRVHGARRFRRDRQAAARVRHWTTEYLVLIAADAAAWAAMPIVFVPYCDPATATKLLGIGMAVAGAAAYVMSHHFKVGLTFLSVLLCPQMVDQLLYHGWAGAVLIAVYLGVLLVNVKRGEAHIVELLRLRYENAWIAEQRAGALELAEQSSAAKTRFLAAVTHEIRTPLNGMFGMTQLLLGSVKGERERRQLQVMERSARHLRTVIGDLLDMSRIEFGKLVVEREPFDVRETVREVADLLACVAADKGLQFSVTFEPGLPVRALGDAVRIKQVLYNLIGNAIKFTRCDSGRGAVSVAVARGASDGTLAICVSDNGDGLSAEQAQRIFVPFEQVGSDVAARRAGTGLGLAISRQLAQAMGGDVACVSQPGQGAAFTLTVAAPDVVDGPAEAVPAGAADTATFCGRVLLVDDNPVNALVASSMLELMGLKVDRAEDGETALQRLAGDTGYDVVLMDCLMPGIDGLEATRRWRRTEALEGRRRIPIVALTASAVADDKARCAAAGMDDHLTKPFSQGEMAAVLARHLRAASRHADAGAVPVGQPARV